MNTVKIEPQKRSKCQPEDTLALADVWNRFFLKIIRLNVFLFYQYCVAGYQTTKVNSNQFVEKCKNVDLKSATGKPCDVVKFTVVSISRKKNSFSSIWLNFCFIFPGRCKENCKK